MPQASRTFEFNLAFLPQTSFTSLSFLSVTLTFTSEEADGWLQPIPSDSYFFSPTLRSFYQLFLNNVEICDSLRVRSRNRNIKISRRGGTLLSSTHIPFTLLIWQDSSLSHHGSRQHSNPNGGPLILRDSPHPCDRCAFHSFGVCEAATKEKGVLPEEISYADHFWRASLHAEDLAFLLGMQQKDLRKLCAKLREDRLIAVYGLPMSSRTLGAHLAEG